MIEINPTTLNKAFVDSLGNSRTLEQYLQMRQLILAGKCAFCNPTGWKHKSLVEIDGWHAKPNDFPYRYSEHHLILLPRDHLRAVDMQPQDFAIVGKLFQWARKEFQIPGGGLVMRFGNPDFNAGTIEHAHAHLQVPDGSGEVKATFAKDPAKLETCRHRIAVFEKMRTGQPLTPEEVALVEGRV